MHPKEIHQDAFTGEGDKDYEEGISPNRYFTVSHT